MAQHAPLHCDFSEDLVNLLYRSRTTHRGEITEHRLAGRNGFKYEHWLRSSSPQVISPNRSVFTEIDEGSGKVRAIKKIQRSSRENYLQEIGVLTKFSCHYEGKDLFVGFQGWFDDAEYVYLIQEHFDLGSLRDWMTTTIQESEARAIAIQVLQALEIVHSNGFSHGNVTANSIMVVQNSPWRVKLGNFASTARHGPNSTSASSELAGLEDIVSYQSPEIYGSSAKRHHPAEKHSSKEFDVWSLGLLTYELVTAQTPFQDDATSEIRYRSGHVALNEGPLRRYNVSPLATEFVLDTLEPDPQRRISAAVALQLQWFTIDNETNGDSPLASDERFSQFSAVFVDRISTATPVNSPIPNRTATNPAIADGTFSSTDSNTTSGRISPSRSNMGSGTSYGSRTSPVPRPLSHRSVEYYRGVESYVGLTASNAIAEAAQRSHVNSQVSESSVNNGSSNHMGLSTQSPTSREPHATSRTTPVPDGNEQEKMIQHAVPLSRTKIQSDERIELEPEQLPPYRRSRATGQSVDSSLRTNEHHEVHANLRPRRNTNVDQTVSRIIELQTGTFYDHEASTGNSPTSDSSNSSQQIVQRPSSYGDEPPAFARSITPTTSRPTLEEMPSPPTRDDIVSHGTSSTQARSLSNLDLDDDEDAETIVSLISRASTIVTSNVPTVEAALSELRRHGRLKPRRMLKLVRDATAAVHPNLTPTIEFKIEQGAESALQWFLDPTRLAETSEIAQNALFRAVEEEEESSVRVFAAIGADINMPKPSAPHQGDTPLVIASSSGSESMIRCLLNLSANPNLICTRGRTALCCASLKGRENAVRYLLTVGADPNISQADGMSPLHLAAQQGSLAVVKTLLEHHTCPPVDTVNANGQTPLHRAVREGHSDIVRTLLSRGANTDAVTTDGLTTLHIAAQMGHSMIVRQLIASGARVQAVDTSRRQTPLHYAASCGNEDVMRVLLHSRVDTSAKDRDGQTALHLAAFGNQTGIVRALYLYGAKVMVRDAFGETPMDLTSSLELKRMLTSFAKVQGSKDVES